MKIALCNRDEAEWIGGDMIQLRAYKKELEKMGHHADYILGNAPDLSNYDEAWLFNLNFQWTFRQARAAKAAGVPYRLFPIFYPKIRHGISTEEMEEVLQDAKAIYALSDGERREIGEEFPLLAEKDIRVIDNGVDPEVFNKKGAKPVRRRRGVVSAGRYMEHKGHLLVMRACKEMGLPCMTIGEPTDPGYYAACKAMSREFMTFVGGPVTQEYLADIFREARLVVCGSDSERNNLVVLEAAACGAEVLDSVHNRAQAMHGFPAADPLRAGQLEEAIKRAYSSPQDRSSAVKAWDEVVRGILHDVVK